MASHEQIVVVDDDPLVREIVARSLEAEGYCCQSFDSARQALAELMAMVPIAAFVDIRMPDMGGLEFLRELRKSHPTLPVIVMTGFAEQDVFRQALEYKIADFLPKPFGPRLVQESLRKALGRDEAFAQRFLETMTFRLRDARMSLRLTQGEVASRCGLSASQVSQIELGQSSPSLATLVKLCKALNLTVSQLVDGF